MRRIELAVGSAMFLDSLLYLAIVPLLPRYVDDFGLSKVQAGLIVAAYPLAGVVTSFAAPALLPRYGGRLILVVTSSVFVIATALFGVAPNGLVLASARFLQGVASGATWSAGMAWLTDNTPAEGRGKAVARALACGSLGSIAGPVVGSAASRGEPSIAFGIVAVVGLVPVVAAWLTPDGVRGAVPGVLAIARRGLRQPLIRAAALLGLFDAFTAAVINLLTPLDLGTERDLQIGAALAIGALLGLVAAGVCGRIADARGPQVVVRGAVTVAVSITLISALPLPPLGRLAVLTFLGPAFIALVTGIYAIAAQGADAAGLGHGTANALLSATWAIGFAVSPPAAALLATVTSDAVAYLAAAAVAIGLAVAGSAALRTPSLAISNAECQ